ncbi:MAG: hypothetical protein KA138_09420 [Saprospiraceae bacterium]|nr:hypothetical protein [Saprospiraceae bacterium]
MKKLTFFSVLFSIALYSCDTFFQKEPVHIAVCDEQLVEEWTGQYNPKYNCQQIHVNLTKEEDLKVQWLVEHNFFPMEKCNTNSKLQIWSNAAGDRTSDDPTATKGKVN